MAKRPTGKKPEPHSWAVYQIAAAQKFVGIVQPDADAAIKQAIIEIRRAAQ